jgi:Na+-driven multidrug efflux pump
MGDKVMHPSAPFLFLLVVLMTLVALDLGRDKEKSPARAALAAIIGGLAVAGFLALALITSETNYHQPEPKEAFQ